VIDDDYEAGFKKHKCDKAAKVEGGSISILI
jgi:hypothetical protein